MSCIPLPVFYRSSRILKNGVSVTPFALAPISNPSDDDVKLCALMRCNVFFISFAINAQQEHLMMKTNPQSKKKQLSDSNSHLE